jgi:hypothetical protein
MTMRPRCKIVIDESGTCGQSKTKGIEKQRKNSSWSVLIDSNPLINKTFLGVNHRIRFTPGRVYVYVPSMSSIARPEKEE